MMYTALRKGSCNCGERKRGREREREAERMSERVKGRREGVYAYV
jgi:hypothetical protein